MNTVRCINLIGALGLCLLSFMAAYAIGQAILSSNKMRVPSVKLTDRERRDLGKRCAGDVVDHEFVFTNNGDHTLRVKMVQPSCNCTDFTIEPTDVHPGASCSLRLSTTLPADIGSEKNIAIQADVFFENYSVPLKVQAIVTVVPEVPHVVDFGRIAAEGLPAKKRFRINPCDVFADVASLRCDDPAFHAQVIGLDPDDDDVTIVEITLTPQATSGTFVSKLLITYADPYRPSSEVSVRAMFTPRIEAEPKSLFLGTILPWKNHSYALSIKSSIGVPFEIRQITSSVDGIDCRASAANAVGTEYLIQVVIHPSDILGSIAGSIVIMTSDTKCPMIVVPVYGVIAENADGATLLAEKK